MPARRVADRRREGRGAPDDVEVAENGFDGDSADEEFADGDTYADEAAGDSDGVFAQDDEYAGDDRDDDGDDDGYEDEADAEDWPAETDGSSGDGDRPAGGGTGRPGLSAAAAARAGLRQIVELTGKEPEGVTAVEAADGGWVVGVEVVDSHRVPASADLLALYEADVDPDGGLMGYRRLRRYVRGRAGSDQAT